MTFEKIEQKAGGSKTEGVFVTVSETAAGIRRIYISAEAREALDNPRHIEYYVDEDAGEIAIAPATEDDTGAFFLHEASGHAGFEAAIAKLDSDIEGRVYLDYDTEREWLVGSFDGGGA